MSESFSALGFLVQTPWGPRKSGMPDSVEMPAPVSTTTRRDCSIQSRAAWMRSFIATTISKLSESCLSTAKHGSGFTRRKLLLTTLSRDSKLTGMEGHLKAETESRLAELASKTGRATDDLMEDALAGYLTEVTELREML